MVHHLQHCVAYIVPQKTEKALRGVAFDYCHSFLFFPVSVVREDCLECS